MSPANQPRQTKAERTAAAREKARQIREEQLKKAPDWGLANAGDHLWAEALAPRAQDPELQKSFGLTSPDDPEKLKKFEAAQSELSGSLSRLLVVAEQYPQLKATDAYRDLQSQLEGTENRIAVARKRYIEAVASYNVLVQSFPTSIGASMRGRAVRPTFQAAPGSDKAPEIKL